MSFRLLLKEYTEIAKISAVIPIRYFVFLQGKLKRFAIKFSSDYVQSMIH